MQPRIGITVSTVNTDTSPHDGKYEAAIAYTRAVSEAEGVPLLLPHEPDRLDAYFALCDGFILTGGGDPATEPFGETTDARARVIDATRQRFELALLQVAGRDHRDLPVLGVCLGMQLMALHAGGRLDQYLPDTLGEQAAASHQHNHRHALNLATDDSVLVQNSLTGARESQTTVVSSHRQAVADPGSLRVVATAPEGCIEAIDDPKRRFYLGVQWHPERVCEREHEDRTDKPLSHELIQRFVQAARSTT